MNDLSGDIPGWLPIFPLPEAVLFPRQILPLHIFEPRYRAMVAEARAGRGLIAVALLKPGYEPRYFTSNAPIHRLVGVGRIVACEQVGDGSFNIILRGEVRAALLEERSERPYRRARVRRVTSCCRRSPASHAALRRELCESIRAFAGTAAHACEELARLFDTPLSLGELADVIAAGLPAPGELRQSLLAELDVCKRARKLTERVLSLTDAMASAPSLTDFRVLNLN